MYYFTIYDVTTRKCNGYLWHEGLAKRGSNEIASCLHSFLKECDQKEKKRVHLFCDSCSGQNRNTIVPSMVLHFLSHSTHVNEVSIYFFEPHHGQNEGDSVHSCVERSLKKFPKLRLPSEIATVIRGCRQAGTFVHEIQTTDILNWKVYSSELGTLRVRIAEDGQAIDWTQVRALRMSKDQPFRVGFKLSHDAQSFSYLKLTMRRQSSRGPVVVTRAYTHPPKLSASKYQDLMDLVESDCPVISHPDHQSFYVNLPHE